MIDFKTCMLSTSQMNKIIGRGVYYCSVFDGDGNPVIMPEVRANSIEEAADIVHNLTGADTIKCCAA